MRKLISVLTFLFVIKSLTAYFYDPRLYKDVDYTQLNQAFEYPEYNLVNTTALGIPYQGQMYTGYLTANDISGAKIFYMLYAAGGQSTNATLNNSNPLILWMQGGPGCSDSLGNFGEIGPIGINFTNGTAVPFVQNVTWNDQYNLLFVDQPVGVGYSPANGDEVNSATQAAEYMQTFLVNFFQLFNSLQGNSFYIFGESYAGHYIPALSSLLIANQNTNGIHLTGNNLEIFC